MRTSEYDSFSIFHRIFSKKLSCNGYRIGTCCQFIQSKDRSPLDPRHSNRNIFETLGSTSGSCCFLSPFPSNPCGRGHMKIFMFYRFLFIYSSIQSSFLNIFFANDNMYRNPLFLKKYKSIHSVLFLIR